MDVPDRGRIVWLEDVIDPQGKNAGPHPAIILTTKQEHENGSPIKAVVISTKLHLGTAENSIPLRSSSAPGGHPQTKLREKCAAMCKWTVIVEESKINRYAGRVFGHDLEKIAQCVKENEDKELSS